MKLLKAIIFLVFLPLSLNAQYHYDVGPLVGGAFYLGDLNDAMLPQFEETGIAYGIQFQYHLGHTMGLRAQLLRGTITGDDQNFDNPIIRSSRNIRFESTLTELSAQFVWEPFGHRRYREPVSFKPIFSPYLFVGLGGVVVDAQPDFAQAPRPNFIERVQADEAQSNPGFFPTIPVGAGVNIDLSSRTALGLELGMRTAFTDYLDGISATGNADRNDWYAFGNVALSYRFGEMDSDGDGVVDKEDTCPNEPGLANAKGCPDRDGDMVPDFEDMCPDQQGPIGLTGCPDRDGDIVVDLFDACPDDPGLPELEGCPDTDGDGITDPKDTCPDKAGPESWEGCPDSDGDTIPDHLDQCPTEAGTLDLQGCAPKDADEDGILDEVDECPEVKGLAAFNGCPDTDGDGVEDRLDKCKDTKGIASLSGCPALTDSVKTLLAKATTDVQFETGSAVLKDKSKAILDDIAGLLNDWPQYQLQLTGHTDSQGKAEKNLKLSKARAKACFDYLRGKNIAEDRMQHDGKGEAEPIGDNDTVEGRRMNRRVAFEMRFVR
jgi:OOP family OmpA-OmpF porin